MSSFKKMAPMAPMAPMYPMRDTVDVRRRRPATAPSCSRREYIGRPHNLKEKGNGWLRGFVYALLGLQFLVNAQNFTSDTASVEQLVNSIKSTGLLNSSDFDMVQKFLSKSNISLGYNVPGNDEADNQNRYSGIVAPDINTLGPTPWKLKKAIDSLEKLLKDLSSGNITCTVSISTKKYPYFFVDENTGIFLYSLNMTETPPTPLPLDQDPFNSLNFDQIDALTWLSRAGLLPIDETQICQTGSIIIALQSIDSEYRRKLIVSQSKYYSMMTIILAFVFCMICKTTGKIYYRGATIAPGDIEMPVVDERLPQIADQVEAFPSPPRGEPPNGGGKNNKKYKKTAEKYGRRCIYISNRNAKYLKIKGEFVAYKTAIKMLNK